MLSLTCGIQNMTQMNLFTKWTDRCTKQTWLPKAKGEEGKLGV